MFQVKVTDVNYVCILCYMPILSHQELLRKCIYFYVTILLRVQFKSYTNFSVTLDYNIYFFQNYQYNLRTDNISPTCVTSLNFVKITHNKIEIWGSE
jgi:hypothetical protein